MTMNPAQLARHGCTISGKMNVGATQNQTWSNLVTAWGDFDYVTPWWYVAADSGITTIQIDDMIVAPTTSVTSIHPVGGSWSNPVGLQTFTVPANTPLWVNGQTMACKSLARSDGSKFPAIITRQFYATGNSFGPYQGALTSTNYPPAFDGTLTSVTGHAIWGGQLNSTNAVGTPSNWTSGNEATTQLFMLNSGYTFHYRKPRKSIVCIGDSLMQGSFGGASHSLSYSFQAVSQLANEGFAVSYTNAGNSGEKATLFQARAKEIISKLRPDIVVIPSYTVNGYSASNVANSTQADWDQVAALYFDVMQYARLMGCQVVMVTPYPNNAYTNTQNTKRLIVRDKVLQAGIEGIISVCDFDVFAESDGKWKTVSTADATHPDQNGHNLMATVLKEAIRKVL